MTTTDAIAQHDAENKALAQAGFVRTGGAGWQWSKGRASIWFDSSAHSLRPWRYFPGGTGVDRRFKTLASLLRAAALADLKCEVADLKCEVCGGNHPEEAHTPSNV